MSGPTAAELLAPLESFGIRLGLDRVRRLLAALGDPQEAFASVLVAGTNGKGSTAAMLAAMASAAGYRTGLFTSPHLEDVEERIRIDGRALPGGELAGLVRRVLAAAGGEPPTYFEALTAAALAAFARRRVELAVLEVGLGGRLDATNAVEPVLSIVTSIALDHAEHLGSTPAAVAAEKAGVLRAARPAVAWIEDEEAMEAVARSARRIGAELHRAERQVEVAAAGPAAGGRQPAVVSTPAGRYTLESPLAGAHQLRNLGLAVRAAELLAAAGWRRLEAETIGLGAAACRWPGRLERLQLPGGGWLLLDGAHNPAAAAALAHHLAASRLRCNLLFGALEGKRGAEMLQALAPWARSVVLTAPPHARAEAPGRLAAARAAAGADGARPPVEVREDAGEALDRLLAGAPRPGLVCGSIYLVGDIRRRLRRRFGAPPPAAETSTYAPAAASAPS